MPIATQNKPTRAISFLSFLRLCNSNKMLKQHAETRMRGARR